jgi:hypothetical protein
MTESDDTPTDSSNDDDLGGVLGEVGLEFDDETNDTGETTGDEPTADDVQQDESSPKNGDPDTDESDGDDGPFAPESGMNLTESFGTKLTPPEKEFIELYVEFSDEYDHSGEFLRAFVTELRQEYGEEIMRRKEALEDLKGGL